MPTCTRARRRPIVESMQATAAGRVIGYYELEVLTAWVRRGVRRGSPYRLAVRERFELLTGHPWPADGRLPTLN